MSSDGSVPDCLPADLVKQLRALAVPELRAAREYIDERIEQRRTPIREQILSGAVGDVVGIEDHGAYALVRMRDPTQDGLDGDPQLVSLYHVTREKRPGGKESLHWAFLGDIQSAAIRKCKHCNGYVDENAESCPHCRRETSEPDRQEGSDA
ncbi:zinc ribbon domain-containing protein [Halovivax limisalsi]|uniref:zinc ribbon domain-containing protein n=1 Tax=Halovivax limisalsi TaxID=1453760 RepID=UPI001FFCC99E|nr:zinc ribbon domain-containing protein [Halovivax limisalsi]